MVNTKRSTPLTAAAPSPQPHGASSAAAGAGYALADFANDIGAVADNLGLQRVVLVGHSLGGAAALVFAAGHPNRVAGLVLVGTPGASTPEQSGPIIASLKSNKYPQVVTDYVKQLTTGAKPEVASTVNDGFAKISRERTIAMIEGVFAYDPISALRTCQGPILSITSASEPDTPTALHNLSKTVRHSIMPGTSHWMQMDKPAEFNTLLDEFLASPQINVAVATKP